MPQLRDARQKQWYEKISRTGYFFAALLLHLVIFILVATWVVFPAFRPPPDVAFKGFTPTPAPTPPTPTPLDPTPHVSLQNFAPTPTPIVSPNSSENILIHMPDVTPPTVIVTAHDPIEPKPRVSTNGISPDRAREIKQFMGTYQENDDSDGDPKNLKMKQFPVYLASYAGGDWDCNVHLTGDGKIDAGSLPNLVAKINQWSHGNIPAEVEPTPLSIGGPDLLAKKPPFIFFTGHKDFVLTDAEVKNLQAYVEEGGFIWGDNALAGQGSRFDVAFRREMKRVVPDKDINFEPVDASDELFTKWFPISKLPAGMNFYEEPLEHLDIDGKVAILYTPNDYSDMLTMRILPGDTDIAGQMPTGDSPLFTNGTFMNGKEVFFRNFELPSCLAAQQLGMNIVGYLLERFHTEMELTP